MDKIKKITPCPEYWRLYYEYIEIANRDVDESAGAALARKELDTHRKECVKCEL